MMNRALDHLKDWRVWFVVLALAGYVTAAVLAYLNQPATAEDYERALRVIDQAVADGKLPKGDKQDGTY